MGLMAGEKSAGSGGLGLCLWLRCEDVLRHEGSGSGMRIKWGAGDRVHRCSSAGRNCSE
jgi:hypothetical protein